MNKCVGGDHVFKTKRKQWEGWLTRKFVDNCPRAARIQADLEPEGPVLGD